MMENNFQVASDRIKSEGIKIAFIYALTVKEPLGISYIASYLKKYLPQITIAFFDPRIDRINTIIDFDPNIVGFSIMSGQFKDQLARAQQLKKILRPHLTIFGGPHPTYFPEMIQEDGVDIICRGEGERPMLNLVTTLLKGDEPFSIKGFWFKQGSRVVKNELDMLLEDLDELPFPDRELIYTKSRLLRGRFLKSVFTSRGCPFSCSYCYNSSLKKLLTNKGVLHRVRMPVKVVAEINELQNKYPVPFLTFGEDVFAGIKLDWLKEFSSLYNSTF